ncbi:MAG: hypothetical protein AAFX50_25315, partial [Acidobacteriota bacterium]
MGERLLNATVERRRGALPYFPLVILGLLGALAALARRDGRPLEAWRGLLAAGLAVDLWLRAGAADTGPGGGLLADPTQAALYPLFFLLAPRLPKAPTRLLVYAAATLLLGSALVSSLGPSAAYGDPQAHTRGGILSRLPLALGHVGRAGVYRAQELGGDPTLDARLWWPRYGGETHGDELWLLGGERLELFLDTARPIDGATLWRLRNLAPDNVVRLRFPGLSERLAFPQELPPGGQGADLRWTATDARVVDGESGEERHVYRLRLSSERGHKPAWRGGEPKGFYLGAALTFLGPANQLDRDVYRADALGCGTPPAVLVGERFQALVRFGNRSQATWNDSGAARIRIAHRWL